MPLEKPIWSWILKQQQTKTTTIMMIKNYAFILKWLIVIRSV
jgi:hypothetical protein